MSGDFAPQQYHTINVPLGENAWVTVRLPCIMSEAAWNQMQNVLSAMKPALVAPPLIQIHYPPLPLDEHR